MCWCGDGSGDAIAPSRCPGSAGQSFRGRGRKHPARRRPLSLRVGTCRLRRRRGRGCSPPGFDSAGFLSSFSDAGVPCNGGVACASAAARRLDGSHRRAVRQVRRHQGRRAASPSCKRAWCPSAASSQPARAAMRRGRRPSVPRYPDARARAASRMAAPLWSPGSAGADGLVSAPGVDCSGCVACAICGLRMGRLELGQREAGDDQPRRHHRGGEQHIVPEKRVSCRPETWFHPRACSRYQRTRNRHGSAGNLRQSGGVYSASNPASPSSAANASIVPLAFHASAETCAVPFLRTRISAPSFSRTIRMVPSL